MADLSAIIVNWNTRELLRRCLDCLVAAASNLDLEIIVVDNGSRDGSQEMLRDEYPRVRLIANDTNVGFAAANNQGAACATAPLLLLINSDAMVRPGAPDNVLNYLSANPAVGIVGLQLLNDDLTLQPSGKRFPTLASTIVGLLPVPERRRMAYDRRRNTRDYSQTMPVDEVSGAAVAIRRATFEALQGFDESYFFFGEDVDLCWRARKACWDVRYLPAAQAIHLWGAARARTPSIRQGLMSQRAQFRLIQRHRPAWQTTVLRAVLIALTTARLIRASLRATTSRTMEARTVAHLYAREMAWLCRW